MDIDRLQARIDASLINPATGKAWMRSSSYLALVARDLQEKLVQADRQGGLEALLDEFDRLRATEDPYRLRVALANVLRNSVARAQMGLRVP